MSNQPPYGTPGGYSGGGYPPPGGGGYPPQGEQKTKVLGLAYNIAGLLCYLCGCIVPILWLATEPRENKFLRFHSIQSLLLSASIIVIWFVFLILTLVLGVGTSSAGNASAAAGSMLMLLMSILSMVFYLAVGIVAIVAMIKAAQNQMWKIPLIGAIADKNS